MVRTGLVSALLMCLCLAASSCTSATGGVASRPDLLGGGLVGWQQMGGRAGSWRFADGTLSAEGDETGWLASTGQYGDFVLSLEFRVGPGASGGVLIRTPQSHDPATAGMEIKIEDDDAGQRAPGASLWPTGSLVGAQAPSERTSRAADVWQKMVVACRGSELKVMLNGKVIVDTSLKYFTHLQANRPGLARTCGYVGLECQAGRIEFRNVRIDVLEKTA